MYFSSGTVRNPLTLAMMLVAAGANDSAAQELRLISLAPADATFDVVDQIFTSVTSIRELSDRTVLVADRLENRIALVDFNTNRSTPVGRTGDGPGEYRGIGWLYSLPGDSAILTDAMSRRWILLDGARTVETIGAEDPLARELGPLLSGADRSGRVLGVVGLPNSTSMRASRETADSLGLVLVDRSGVSRDTVGRMHGRGRNGACFYGVRDGRPFYRVPCDRMATEDLAILSSDGWIAIAVVSPYHVEWRTPEGRWIRGAPLPFEPIPVDDRVKCARLGRQPGLGMARSCDVEGSIWPESMPAFLFRPDAATGFPFAPVLLATDGGSLLIRRSTATRNDSMRYDVVDRQAELVGAIILPNTDAIVGFGPQSVYTVHKTEDGLEELRRHPWQEPRRSN